MHRIKPLYDHRERQASADTRESFVIVESAYQHLINTVGKLRAETGGLLFGSRDDNIVQEFYYDNSGSRTRTSYDPDVEVLNPIIKRYWEEKGLALIGWAHSHPRGISRLSGDFGGNTGDLGYLAAIFDAIPSLDTFLVPILHSTAEGRLKIFPHIAHRETMPHYIEGKLQRIDDAPKAKKLHPASPPQVRYKTEEIAAKVKGAINLDLVKSAHVFAVGCGGANNIYENLVRIGIGKLTVMDYDEVETSNLVTQGWYADQIGKLKVDALRENISRVLPDPETVDTRCSFLNANFLEMSDEELIEQAEDADLLMFMTDDFWAQARGNRLALTLGKPAIFAMMYEKARCSEITFMIPGVTPACHRCAMSPRYEAYMKQGYENDVGSEGSLIFQTHVLNSLIGKLALAILHNDKPAYEFGGWFGKYWDRTLIQTRISPKYESGLFDKTFGNEPRTVCFDSIWQKIEPERPPKYGYHCPDCGGNGDLRNAVVSGTRISGGK